MRDPEGEEIEKSDQLVNVKDLVLKLREIATVLKLHEEGLVTDVSEKRILQRFTMIRTTEASEKIYNAIWEGEVPENAYARINNDAVVGK